LFLVDVYKQAELKPDSGNKGKLLSLLRSFDSEEPTRKKFVDDMIGYVLLENAAMKLILVDGVRNSESIQLVNLNYTMLREHCMQKNTKLTRLNDISHLERRTLQKCLRNWNMSGILRTIYTQLLFTLPELCSHIFSLAMLEMRPNPYDSSQAD